MPEKATLARARAHLRKGDAPSTAAGEFIREEIEHIRHGKHGARSTKQAIAIGLSKARRAGIPLEDPRAGNPQTKKQARRDREAGKHPHQPDARRSRATKKALKREPHRTASKKALSRHAKRTAKQAAATRRRHERTGAVRSRRSAAKKAAQTRKRTASHSTRARARKRTTRSKPARTR
ncbi:MAG: DUF6496 domain-containing protein [Kofleriaceae bacterium]